MAKTIISKRLKFKYRGSQKLFILKAMKSLNFNILETATLLGIHRRTLSDWMNEKFNMSYDAVKLLSFKAKISFPKQVKTINWTDHLEKIAKSGGIERYRKYGKVSLSEDKRQKAWKEWWEKEGRFRKPIFSERKKIKKPAKNARLSEFVGIMIGDGGMVKYHITVTLNSRDDYEYSNFVKSLITELFGVKPKVYIRKKSSALDIVVHRAELVDFLKSMGLKSGNKLKQNLNIPPWIKKDKKFKISCIRGLTDTDGSVFSHCYTSKGKRYCYTKVNFTSLSPRLLKSVYDILKELNIKSKIRKHNNEIVIENRENVLRYMEIVGTHNPKHKKKFNVLWRVAPNGKAAVC